jgi:hypothetical protein
VFGISAMRLNFLWCRVLFKYHDNGGGLVGGVCHGGDGRAEGKVEECGCGLP